MTPQQQYDFVLGHGPGSAPDEACLMQRAALIHAERHGYLGRVPVAEVLTDHPCWANEALTAIAIVCNDFSSDEERQRLRPLLERVVLATRKAPEVERRVNARLLCQQARKVLHLVAPEDRGVCEAAIAVREAWLRGEATEAECQEAARAAWAAWAAEAAEAAWAAGAAGAAEAAEAAWAARAAGAAWAAEAAWAAWAARAAGAAEAAEDAEDAEPDWCEWLDDALDAHSKAVAEEGAMMDDHAEELVADFIQASGS